MQEYVLSAKTPGRGTPFVVVYVVGFPVMAMTGVEPTVMDTPMRTTVSGGGAPLPGHGVQANVKAKRLCCTETNFIEKKSTKPKCVHCS